jgi:hypothetical protein
MLFRFLSLLHVKSARPRERLAAPSSPTWLSYSSKLAHVAEDAGWAMEELVVEIIFG